MDFMKWKPGLLAGLVLLMMCIAGTAGAQTPVFTVKGILMDSLTHESEPYATVRIVRKDNPSKPVKMAVTDHQGKFQEQLKQEGTYRVVITSIGKLTVTRDFTVGTGRKLADLGTLYTAEATEQLKGVEVVAQKPLVKAEIDKIAYSVEDDPDSKTNTTLEMLRKVPLVTVDGEDNIQVNGSSSFKVHVNGKPNTLMSNNPKEVLRSLPANTVKSIEVITDPGAKYDAEGIGGILNIITTAGRMQGYNVTVNARAGNQGVGGGAYGTVQVGKFTVTGNYSYSYNDPPASFSESGREDYTSDTYRHLTSSGKTDSYENFQYGYLEGSYEVDTLNLITFSANWYGGLSKSNGSGFTRMQNKALDDVYTYTNYTHARNRYGYVGFNADYQRSMRKKGEYLTLSYKLNRSPDSGRSWNEYTDFTGDYPTDLFGPLVDRWYDNDAHTTEHTGQLDYVNPISKIHYVDGGVKYIHRDNRSVVDYQRKNTDTGVMEPDTDLSSDYLQRQQILALYTDYQLKLKKFGAKVGLRYEHTFTDVKYADTPERNFNKGFDDLVPSANLTYMLGQSKTLRATYNLRINRPGIWYLNPFRDVSNPASVRYGNPDLETEKSHNLGLTFSSFSAKFSLNASLNYAFRNNGISSYSFMSPTQEGVMETTYGNIVKNQNTRLSLWVNWNPGSKTRISVNMSGSYLDYQSDQLRASNNGFTGNVFANIQQTLPGDIRLSVNGGGGTPYISLQGKGSSYGYYSFGLSRSFLKEKRLTVSVHASNVFRKYRTGYNETITDTFRSWSNYRYVQQYYGMNISWRFGELKAQVKKTARSITNDDVKAGEGSSQGGGSSSGGN